MDNKAFYQEAHFLLGAAKLSQLPHDKGIEVAFVGRSNAGKSSVLNVLCQQKSLARTSKTPGRTQQINVFGLDDGRRLIDLPGYGYAKVSEKVKKEWQETLDNYLQQRACLKGVVLIMDIRHPFKPFDTMMLEWSYQSGLPTHVLLNKADKLKRGPAKNTLLAVLAELKPCAGLVTAQTFSALKRTGCEDVYAVLDNWFNLQESNDA